MLAILLLAATAANPASAKLDRPRAAGVIRQAEARVRIIAGARVTASEVPEVALVKDKVVTGADGSERPALLVEFP